MTLSRPTEQGKWLVWPDTVFADIDSNTCSSTPAGYCPDSLSLQECIDYADKNNCTYGYHIELPDKTTLCNPILPELYGDINPVYGLVADNEFPTLSKSKVHTFVNSDFHVFPPQNATIMFYTDIFQLHDGIGNAEVGIASDKLIPDDGDVINVGKKIMNLQIYPHNISIPTIQKYVPVRYGDYVNICVPNTTLLLSKDVDGLQLEWKINSTNIPFTDFAFQLIPLPSSDKGKPGKQLGDIVKYTDQFNIVYSENYVVTTSNNMLMLKYYNKSNIPVIKRESTFSAASSMYGYYCSADKCTPIGISDIEYDSTYKGALVFRSPNCLGQCIRQDRAQEQRKAANVSLMSMPYETIVMVAFIVLFVGIIVLYRS